MNSSLLISEPPLQVLPSLARYLKSSDKAIIVQQIFYWEQKSTHIHDGHRWVYNTVKEWHKQFPWISEKTIQRYLKDLEDRKILITANYNKSKFDRTKWYRVNQNALDNLTYGKGRSVPTKGTGCPNQKGTSCPNLYQRIPKTTTENNSSSATTCPNEPSNAFEKYQMYVGMFTGTQTPIFSEYVQKLGDKVVSYAIDSMLDYTSNPNFSYLESVLKRYERQGINSVEKAKMSDEKHKNVGTKRKNTNKRKPKVEKINDFNFDKKY